MKLSSELKWRTDLIHDDGNDGDDDGNDEDDDEGVGDVGWE